MTRVAHGCGGAIALTAASHRRPDAQSNAEAEQRKIRQQPGSTRLGDAEVVVGARPAIGLLQTLNATLDVETPLGEAGAKEKTLDGDQDLRRPASLSACRRRFPDRVPAGVLAAALVGDQRVVARSARVYGEHITGAAVEVGVEYDLDVVFRVEHRVSLAREAHDAGRLGVVRAHTDDDRIRRRDHPNDRTHSRRSTFIGLYLSQTAYGVGGGPHWLGQLSVEVDLPRRGSEADGRAREYIPGLSPSRAGSAKNQAEHQSPMEQTVIHRKPFALARSSSPRPFMTTRRNASSTIQTFG